MMGARSIVFLPEFVDVRPRARLFIAVLAALAFLPASGRASDVCGRLRAELAGLPRVVADTQSARKYASAIASQNIELRKARSDLRRLGCGSHSVTVIGGPNAGACATLTAVIGKMERNLKILDGKRRQYSAGVSGHGARARLLAALDAKGCNDGNAAVLPAAATETLRTLDGTERSTLFEGVLPEGGGRLGLLSPGSGGRGNLRTVCVRTCDGGFFPISSGATPLDFRRDQKICAMMCPQTETELFYHPLAGGQETGDMTSTATGRPYSALPNAFSYRTRDLSKPGNCGCDLSAYYREMIRREKALKAGGETAAHDDGKDALASGSIADISALPRDTLPLTQSHAGQAPVRPERAYDPASSKVRVVGPLFLPTEESAIDLGRPAEAAHN